MYKDSKNKKNIVKIKLENGDRKSDMIFRKLTNFAVYLFVFAVILFIWVTGTYQQSFGKLLISLLVRLTLSSIVMIILYIWRKLYQHWDNKYYYLEQT